MSAGLVVTQAVGIVETDIDARREIRREPDEPGVAPVIGCTGLPGDRLADCLHGFAGTPLYDALQHRHDLERRARIGYLLTRVWNDRHRLASPFDIATVTACSLIGAKDSRAIAILNPIDKGR